MSKPITIIYSNGSAHPKTSLGWADHAKLIAILHVAKVVIVMSHSLLHMCTCNDAHVDLLHMHVADISMLGMGFNGVGPPLESCRAARFLLVPGRGLELPRNGDRKVDGWPVTSLVRRCIFS